MNKKEISRIEAEDLIKKMGVLHSEVQYKHKEMQILFRLSNRQNFFMTYNFSNHHKSYYIVD